MNSYGTPLKHSKAVNKPFRSPLLDNDKNPGPENGTLISQKLKTNSRLKLLGFKSPMRSQGFISQRPLEFDTRLKSVETKSRVGFSSPLKSHKSRLNSALESFGNKSLRDSSSKPMGNDLLVKDMQISSLSNPEDSSRNLEWNKQNIKSKLRLMSNNLVPNIDAGNPSSKIEYSNTPPVILHSVKNVVYEPVVKLQRLSYEVQNQNLSKMNLILLMNRVSSKQREMFELKSAKMSTIRKHYLQEISASIIKWREAFMKAMETICKNLAEKNGRPFSASDVLRILSISSSVVYFSDETNDFIFPKI